MINAVDTYGLLGNVGATSDGQALLDDIANRVLNQLVSNATFQNTIANYVSKSMITELATQTVAQASVLDGREKNPSVSGSMAASIKTLNDALANLSNDLGGVSLSVNMIPSGGGTKAFSANHAIIIVASSTANHAIFQCRNDTVITHASAGSSITCTANGTTYTVTNNTTAAARYFALTANGYSS